MKYSKFPWRVKTRKNDQWSIMSADGYCITGIAMDEDYGRPGEDPNNAKLMAAAPTLLEQAKAVICFIPFDQIEPSIRTTAFMRQLEELRQTVVKLERA